MSSTASNIPALPASTKAETPPAERQLSVGASNLALGCCMAGILLLAVAWPFVEAFISGATILRLQTMLVLLGAALYRARLLMESEAIQTAAPELIGGPEALSSPGPSQEAAIPEAIRRACLR